MMLLAVWYLQDVMQVLLTTAFLAPELFFLALTHRARRREFCSCWYYLLPLAGGLLFDLRWSGLPGLCAGLYVAGLWLFRMIWWNKLPRDGQTAGSYFALNLVLCALMGAARIAFWRGNGSTGHLVALWLFQMALTVPPLWIFSRRERYAHETGPF